MAINVKDKLVTLESLGVAYSAEQEAREDADQALSTRIDNIVAPEGDPSLTEVSDARVSGSTTYNTLKARLDADKAAIGTEISQLSADLESDIFNSETVDLTTATGKVGFVSSTSGNWINRDTDFTYFIPVREYDKKVTITANSERPAVLSILRNDGVTHNRPPSYATGAARESIPAGTSKTFVIPSDAKYLAVGKIIAGNNNEPESVVILSRKHATIADAETIAEATGAALIENYIDGTPIKVDVEGEWRTGVYIQTSSGSLGITDEARYKSFICEAEPNTTYIITTNGNRLIYGLYNTIAANVSEDVYFNANDSTDVEHTIENATSAYLVVYCSYQQEDYPEVKVKKVINKPIEAEIKTHFNILIFGNSYAADAWGYVPFILKKYGITVNIYMYYRGSGSPSRLVQEWEDTSYTGYDIYGGSHVRRMTHIDTRTMTAWEPNVRGRSAKMILELANDPANDIDKWDIITLQLVSSEQYQVNGEWTMAPGIEPSLRQIINLINASYSNTYTLGFLETYNRIVTIGGVPISVLDNRIATMQANEAAYKAEPFGLMIPVGAAVFSGRTNTLLSSTDVSDMGNLWATDLTHLQEGVPCYLAACTVCQAIFKKYFPEYSVLGDDTRITSDILTSWNVQFTDGTPKEASELAYQLAQKCAVVANERPFDISPIYMPDDMTEIVYDRSKYWADSMIDTSSITNPTAEDENA